MQNVFFQALEGALKDGAFIKVFICGAGYPVVRVEKRNPEGGDNTLMAYYESGRVIDGLFGAGKSLMTESMAENVSDEDRAFECLAIEKEVSLRGYPLVIVMQPTGQFLSMLCSGCGVDYLPLVSANGKDVQTSLELLNALLSQYDFDSAEFIRFADKQEDIKYEYYKKRRENTTDKEKK